MVYVKELMTFRRLEESGHGLFLLCCTGTMNWVKTTKNLSGCMVASAKIGTQHLRITYIITKFQWYISANLPRLQNEIPEDPSKSDFKNT
jgi:hypothetical protein